MSPEERHTWTYAVVALVVPSIYFAYLAVQMRHTAVTEFAYQRPLLTAVGASIVVLIFAQAVVSPSGKARRDQRDRDINRHGEFIGFFVLAFGFVPAFVLTILDQPHFWIANAMYVAYVLNVLTSSAVKIIAYRRGL